MLRYILTTFKLKPTDVEGAFIITELALPTSFPFLNNTFYNYEAIQASKGESKHRPEIIDFEFSRIIDGSSVTILTLRYHVESGCGIVKSANKRDALIFKVTDELSFELYLIENRYSSLIILLQQLMDHSLNEICPKGNHDCQSGGAIVHNINTINIG